MRVTIYITHPITVTRVQRDRGTTQVSGPVWAVRIFKDPDAPSWEDRWAANAVLLEQPVSVRNVDDEVVANELEVDYGDSILALVWPEATLDTHRYASLWYYGPTSLGGVGAQMLWVAERPDDIEEGEGVEYGNWKYLTSNSGAMSSGWLHINMIQPVSYDRRHTFGIEIGRLITGAIGAAQREAREVLEEDPYVNPYGEDLVWHYNQTWTLNNEPLDLDNQPPPPDENIVQPTKSASWLPFLLAAGAVMVATRKKR